MDDLRLYLHRLIPMWQVLALFGCVLFVALVEKWRKSHGTMGEEDLARKRLRLREAEDAITTFIENKRYLGDWTNADCKYVYGMLADAGWKGLRPWKIATKTLPARVVKATINRRRELNGSLPIKFPDSVPETAEHQTMTLAELLK